MNQVRSVIKQPKEYWGISNVALTKDYSIHRLKYSKIINYTDSGYVDDIDERKRISCYVSVLAQENFPGRPRSNQ